MAAIEFKNLYFRYNSESKILLRNLNIQLDYGSFVLITGDSGIGKSTIMNLINGTIPNYIHGDIAGDILINGVSNKKKSISEISKEVGSVLQNADMQIIHEIVEDEIAFGCENLCMNKDDITKLVDKYTDLLSLDKKYETKKLSGGQKQRLITASTLSMGQHIIMLDEPLANLDNKASIVILNILKRLVKEENYLVILVEHRMDRLKDYADLIYVLENETLQLKTYQDIASNSNEEIEYGINNNINENVLISLENVSVKFKNKLVLDNISFDIFEGERLLILGENGIGKTTLSKIISRLIKPTVGKVCSNISKRHWFKNVGYIFQNPDYQLFMPTVKKELEYACKDKELLEYSIKYLKIEDILDHHPYSLSEGQKRKIAALSIILMAPKLLILDEPTVGLDNESLIKLLDIINILNEKYGTAVISITHDKRCAKALSDRVIWLQDKRIYKMGDKELVDLYFMGDK